MDSKYAFTNAASKLKKPTTLVTFSTSNPNKRSISEQSPAKRILLAENGLAAILSQRKSLPVYAVRGRILEEIKKHSTLIIIGETGSGKTTQIPQFIHEERLDKEGRIGITQPRRVAAITISLRVAQEMNTKQGEIVGYTVRFEDVTSENTKLKYLTDGMLLREAISDNLLMKYSVIVLDEAHERTVHTDVLFGIVKQAQKTRKERGLKPLKILVMSATMDVDHFSNYFGNVPILYLEGRQHPVKIFHTIQPQEDYVFSSLVTIFQIHREAPANHDILVFLTGQEEIESMAHHIRLIARDLEGKAPPLRVYPLYSSLPSHQQLDVFRPTSKGMRKVILSTNVAETSVTISGIKYVIDSGMVKARSHHPGTGLDILKVQRISQAQAWQRTGRAGRESTGYCYRVYTRKEFESLPKNSVPEIQRCNLTGVVLQLLALGVNCVSFDFIDKPPRESLIAALQQLKQLNAIESVDSPVLTKLGHQMSQFPLDPRFSKILLAAKDYNCVEEVISIVALLSSESVFVTPPNKREEALSARQKFVSSAGDHITLLNVFRTFSKISQKKQWCHENFLNVRNLQYASDVYTQLLELCKRCKVPLSSCGQDIDKIRKCLVTGLFMNVAELQRERQYITVDTRQAVTIHPSSVLFGSYPPFVLFTEVVQTGRCYLRQISTIEPEWLLEIVPNYIRNHKLSFSSVS
ncbi:ATP-dependent RNA helicase DHX33 isoform X1 [Schistocerca piceifrons]|uniref:ATP-dependent RNA helicase DHX33 isoform X1 n=2 Tax=Schistocerca piceifrons TaxID=274613 RepID=UPI001F5F179C|nr:ATP-dependent RNA helicase DHX33 isoform X1 [Schistocerca piceifrons]